MLMGLSKDESSIAKNTSFNNSRLQSKLDSRLNTITEYPSRQGIEPRKNSRFIDSRMEPYPDYLIELREKRLRQEKLGKSRYISPTKNY